MARNSPIRWKSGEQDELRKEIRRFNDRRRRAIRKNPMLAGLVPTIRYTDVIKNITTRTDYSRVMRELNWSRAKNAFNLTRVGNADVTRWELRRTKARLRTINRAREREREKANVSTEKGTMGKLLTANLLPKRIPAIRNQTAWRKFVEGVETQVWDDYFNDKSKLYAENYLKAWKNNFGNIGLKEITKILSKMEYYDIAQAIFDNSLLDIDFVYGKDDIEIEDKVEAIINAWKDYQATLKY